MSLFFLIFIYIGFSVSSFLCFGIQSDDDSVCSSRGNCTVTNICDCDLFFYDRICNVTICGVFFSNETEVCNGNGECTSPHRCECDNGFKGAFCDENSSYNATPIIVSGIILVFLAIIVSILGGGFVFSIYLVIARVVKRLESEKDDEGPPILSIETLVRILKRKKNEIKRENLELELQENVPVQEMDLLLKKRSREKDRVRVKRGSSNVQYKLLKKINKKIKRNNMELDRERRAREIQLSTIDERFAILEGRMKKEVRELKKENIKIENENKNLRLQVKRVNLEMYLLKEKLLIEEDESEGESEDDTDDSRTGGDEESSDDSEEILEDGDED